MLFDGYLIILVLFEFKSDPIRVIRNLTDHERQSKTNSMVYLKNFQSNRFQKYDKKVISWHYPKFDKNTWVQGRNWGS